jgi:hypothetical protein
LAERNTGSTSARWCQFRHISRLDQKNHMTKNPTMGEFDLFDYLLLGLVAVCFLFLIVWQVVVTIR